MISMCVCGCACVCALPHAGKARVHHSTVISVVFGETPSGQTRLFSLGNDNRIAEYELARSTPSSGLLIAYHQDFTWPHKATAISFAPPLEYHKQHSNRTLLLIADEAFKVRMYDPDMKACVSVFLGPTFGGPLQKLLMFK